MDNTLNESIFKFKCVVTKLTCRKEIHRGIARADKSCKVVPRNCMNGTRRFDTTRLSHLQRSKHPFHIRGFLDPWRSDHHNVTMRRLPITWWHSGVTSWSVIDKNGHFSCTAANDQQLFSPASACYWFNSTAITILSTSQNPQIHQELALSPVDDASDPQHFSTKLFPVSYNYPSHRKRTEDQIPGSDLW